MKKTKKIIIKLTNEQKEAIYSSLKKKKSVSISKVGQLKVSKTTAKKGFDPSAGKHVSQKRIRISLRPSTTLKKYLKSD